MYLAHIDLRILPKLNSLKFKTNTLENTATCRTAIAGDFDIDVLMESYPPKTNLFFYLFGCDENLHTFIKSKIKWSSCHELFPIFHRKRVIYRKRKKMGFAVTNRMV